MNDKPMSIKELSELKPGDQYLVSYNKDDNPDYVRCDKDLQTVHSNDGSYVLSDEGYEWDYANGVIHGNWELNEIDVAGRGSAFFFYNE